MSECFSMKHLAISPREINQRIWKHREEIINNEIDDYEMSKIKQLLSDALYIQNENREMMIDYIAQAQDFPDGSSFSVYIVKTFIEGVKTTGGYGETANFWNTLPIEFYAIEVLKGRFIAFVREIPVVISLIKIDKTENKDVNSKIMQGYNLWITVPDNPFS